MSSRSSVTGTGNVTSEAKTLREFKNDWNLVRGLVDRLNEEEAPNELEADPFDCGDLVLDYVNVQADQIADDIARRWRTLDHRKIVGERPGWYQRRVRLPENFRFDKEPEETSERVIDVDNPTATLSYTSELWKLFEKVPTAGELKEKSFSGRSFPRTAAVFARDDCRHRKRMRLSQCHDVFPRPLSPFVSAIRIEFWKNQPTANALPDKNRLVLEFSEDQTLLDIHHTLVLLAATNKGEEINVPEKGFFFIEGIFYVSHESLSLQSIIDWLGADKTRLVDVGLSSSSADVKLMKDTSLGDLCCRLGVRYCHQSTLSFESAVFFTDRRMASRSHDFPMIHDIWLDSDLNCEACLSEPATRATSTTSPLGHRALCRTCCQSLRVPDPEHKCYTVWEGG